MKRRNNNPLELQVYDIRNGERIGALEPAAFRKYVGAPEREFLAETIRRFNERKAELGEPERVRQAFRAGVKRIKVGPVNEVGPKA